MLAKCYEEYRDRYTIEFDGTICNWEFKIHKVKAGQGYHAFHCENTTAGAYRDRFLTYMTYLQVPEEGGETEFLHQHRRIKPVVGRTLMWPPGFTHLHRGNSPLVGDKTYITGWFCINLLSDQMMHM